MGVHSYYDRLLQEARAKKNRPLTNDEHADILDAVCEYERDEAFLDAERD